MSDSGHDLRTAATEFAERLTNRIRDTLPGEQPQFGAVILPGPRPGLLVAPADPTDADQVTRPLTMTIPGRVKPQILHLRAVLYCCLDSRGQFLTIEKSQFSVGLADVPEPIVRFEYEREQNPTNRLPAAHVQVHAHRDEVTYLMAHADEGRPKDRWRRQRLPRLSQLHIPVGGDRYRPCLEDVIWIAANEFGAQLRVGGWQALEVGRAEWRRLQLAAAVRDAPDVAAKALRAEGWSVEPADRSNADERDERLRRI